MSHSKDYTTLYQNHISRYRLTIVMLQLTSIVYYDSRKYCMIVLKYLFLVA